MAFKVNTFWYGTKKVAFECPFCRHKVRGKFASHKPIIHIHGCSDYDVFPMMRGKHCELEDIPRLPPTAGETWEFQLCHPVGVGTLELRFIDNSDASKTI